jgi:putative hydrolase of HD superfamily
MPTNPFTRDLEFIYEIGALRYMQRSWARFLNPSFQNNTEHMYRVAWIALTIAKYEGATNTDKILKMALLHDIAESRTGDVDYISRQYVERHEDKAITDMMTGTAIAAEIIALAREYEKRECIEAKIVKDADNLDVDFELSEQRARGHVTLFQAKQNMRAKVAATKLYTGTAKQMWDEIQEANPHDWHHNAQGNRFNSGDWSDAKDPGVPGQP